MEERILLEVTPGEFVAIMAALDFVSSESEIRTLYTDFHKSSDLCDPAQQIFDSLDSERFREILRDHLDEYYKENE